MDYLEDFNFDISEFKAESLRPWQQRSLYTFVLTVLQPIRDRFGRVIVSSGYRSKEYNAKIKGASKTSEHMYGEQTGLGGKHFDSWCAAADIKNNKWDVNDRLEIVRFANTHLKYSFGQLIWYAGTNHLHISLATRKHRGQMLFKDLDNKYHTILRPLKITLMDERFK